MFRPLAAAVVLAVALPAVAADPPAGNWKLTLRADRQPVLLLVAFGQTDGKWVGDVIDATARFPQDPKFADVTVAGESLKFTLTLAGQTLLSFDGVVAKDGKKITGSTTQPGGPLELTEMRPSALKKLADTFELMKETLAQTDDAATAFDAATVVVGQAAAKKMKPEEVRGVLDRVAKLAAGYGPRWERTTAVKLATVLVDQDGHADAALAQARRAERLLTDDDDATTRLEVLEPLARVLAKSNKADDAKKYEVQIVKLEARDFADYAKTNPPFKPESFAGRKAKSDRVVLVELFSGAEFGPCVAFDLARDAVLTAYKPADVLVLNYHVPIQGGPDPLANPDSLDRAQSYTESIRRAGFLLVNGKPGPRAKESMGPSASKEVFAAAKEMIDEQLEKPAAVKLAVTATAGEKGFAVKAVFSDLGVPPEKLAIRFAVTEERVRYPAGNGVRYHHQVVRAMPGGAKGFPLTGKAGEQAVTVNVGDVREKLVKFLDDFGRENEFPRPDRPLGLKNLRVIAFVQNDATAEVLAAAAVELK